MIRFGTRRSPLAQAQTDRVIALHPGKKVRITSDGDRDLVSALHRMAPGAFTRTLTTAILDGRVDAAVHSLKDLPLDAPRAAPVVAVLERDDPADVVLVRADAHDPASPLHLMPGSRVGTSAPRRQSQVRGADPSLVCVDVRGNIQTRVGLLGAGVVDGLLMAAAVLERMHVDLPAGVTRHRLDPRDFPGSPGQGAIAVQAHAEHSDDLRHLDHAKTRRAAEAEREVLRALGGGCGLPLGCHVGEQGGTWHLWATYGHPEGLARVHLHGQDVAALVAPAVRGLRAAPERATPPDAGGGLVVLMTLEPERLGPFRDALAGARVQAWPLIESEDTGHGLPDGWDACGWIAVTSRRAADAAARAMRGFDTKPRVAAVGPATAEALRRHGMPVHVVARDGTGGGLAEAIAAYPRPPAPVLAPQAERPSGGLRDGLAAHGHAVLDWPVYRTAARATPRPPCDVVVLCSASAARAYAEAPHPPGPRLIALGPSTGAAMRGAGLEVHATCPLPGPEGVRRALEVEA